MQMIEETLQKWHDYMDGKGEISLDDILAEDVVFHSPVVHTPQKGREITKMYLAGAAQVLGKSDFQYVRTVKSDNNAVLEFTAEIEGIHVNGIDLIQVNDEGKIVDFKVMLRPLKAVNIVHKGMAAMLEKLAPK
jgi:hypothetical protein